MNMDAEPEQPKKRDVGWIALACVAFGWFTSCAGIGVPFLLGGGLMALVICVTDLQSGRRVSRPVLAALLGSAAIVLVLGLLERLK